MRSDPTHEAERFITLLWNDIYARVRGMLHPHHKEHEPGGKDQLRLRLGELFDVTANSPGNGDALVYNTTTKHWSNSEIDTVMSLNDLTDVVISTPIQNHAILEYQGGLAYWTNGTALLANLADVALGTAIADNDVLTFGSLTQKWTNEAPASGGYGQAFFEVLYPYVATIPGPTNLTGNTLTIKEISISSNGEVSGAAAGLSFAFGTAGGATGTADISTAWNDDSSLSATIAAVGVTATYLTVDVYFTS